MFDLHQTDYLRDRFNNLRHGAPARLAQYKAARDKSLQTIRRYRATEQADAFIKASGAASWKNERWVTPHGMGFNTPAFGIAKSDTYGGILCMDTGALDHLRSIRADDKTRNYGTGWYADSDGNETITGKVVQLPTHKGERRWLAYAVHSDQDGIWVDRHVYTDPGTACLNANRLAERIAEVEREYNDRWEAARDLDDKIEDVCTDLRICREHVHQALEVLRAQRKLGPLADALLTQTRMLVITERGRVSTNLETLANLREERKAIDVEG